MILAEEAARHLEFEEKKSQSGQLPIPDGPE